MVATLYARTASVLWRGTMAEPIADAVAMTIWARQWSRSNRPIGWGFPRRAPGRKACAGGVCAGNWRQRRQRFGISRFLQILSGKTKLTPSGRNHSPCLQQTEDRSDTSTCSKKKVKHIFNDHAVNTWVVTDKSTVCSEEQKVERHGSDKLPPANVYLRKNQVLPQ